MSYCRFGPDSDVYLIRTFGGTWDCFCALQMGKAATVLDSLEDTLAHMQNHVRRGDKVPPYAIERLERELAERGTDAAGDRQTQESK